MGFAALAWRHASLPASFRAAVASPCRPAPAMSALLGSSALGAIASLLTAAALVLVTIITVGALTLLAAAITRIARSLRQSSCRRARRSDSADRLARLVTAGARPGAHSEERRGADGQLRAPGAPGAGKLSEVLG